MDLQLKGKRAFISGSTKGIGRAIAQTLVEEGAEVIINGRTQKAIDETISDIKMEFPDAKIIGFPCDFTQPKTIDDLISTIGVVDILINNVGIFEPKEFLEITDEDWQKFYTVNVLSGVKLSRAFLPHMLSQDWGRITCYLTWNCRDNQRNQCYCKFNTSRSNTF